MSERQKNPGRDRPGGKRGFRTGKGTADSKRADKPREKSDASSATTDRPTERIAKRLARAGISSRRDAEALVEAGRVAVNGKVLSSPAFNVSPDDHIAIDGTPIPAIERTRLFLFHKPAGVVTTNRDPDGRQTVFDVLPAGLPRLMTIGRLDINTEGLLLLTNDGGLARVLELPSTGWLRRYRVRVHGEVDEAALAGLKDGIAVNGVFYGAVEAALDRKQGTNAWLTIGLREGKNREVKNILGALGLEVTRLIRISYGPFQLGELAEGEVRELRGRALRDQLGERLIEEAGANFDAPVTTPFSRKQPEAQAERQETSRSPRPARGPRIEEGGLIRNRKREREQKREDALGRLTTKGPRRERTEKRDQPTAGRRSANVWMAPGARPGRAKASEDGASGEAARGKDSATGRSRMPRKGERPAGNSGDRAGKSKGEKPSFRKKREGGHGEGRESRPAGYGKAKPSFGQKSSGRKPSRTNEKGWHGDTPNGKPIKSKRSTRRAADHAPDGSPRARSDDRKGKPGADRRR
jgi:23S rRNA pseudouridine2605 synthase